MEEEVEEVWIEGEESAKAMLERVLRERPLLLLLPPLHRVPLRFGNVVELLGPSPSAKTHILIQVLTTTTTPTTQITSVITWFLFFFCGFSNTISIPCPKQALGVTPLSLEFPI